MYKLSYIDSPQ